MMPKTKGGDQTTLERKLMSFPGYFIWLIEDRTHFSAHYDHLYYVTWQRTTNHGMYRPLPQFLVNALLQNAQRN
jgi:hypothetical protein